MNLVTRYVYDEAGRKTFETNANPELIQFRYDPSGSLTNLIDGKNQGTVWHYDAYGRVTNKLDQASVEILRYYYDAAGRLASRWSKAKGYTYYTNDAVGNVTYVKYPASTSVSFQYDALNRPAKMVDAVGTTTYSYTSGGLLWTEGGVFASDTVTNGYANRKRVSLALRQPSGTWTNGFGYDGGGRLTSVASPAGSFGYTYAAGSASPLPFKISLPNTAYITNVYDNMARLSGTWLKNSGGTTLDCAVYGYNQAGWRTAFTNTASTYVLYTYDNIQQLKIGTSSVSSENRGYYYDAAWNVNWVTNNGVASHYLVDGKNELTSANGKSKTYDANGNQASSGNLIYSYDDENRLTSVQDNSSHTFNASFAYDGLGRLRKRVEYYWYNPGSSPSGGAGAVAPLLGGSWQWLYEIHYIYDGNRVIQERDGNNTPLVSYTRGNDLSQSLEGAGGIGGLLARSHGYYSGGAWTVHTFYHADGLGNITCLVDTNQSVAASYRYDPFGNTLSSSGALAATNVYRFSSKECHVASGMYYYLYRFCDPSVQRWINRDPLGEWGGVNLYEFTYNDPSDYFDSDGLRPPPKRPVLKPPAPMPKPPKPMPKPPLPKPFPKPKPFPILGPLCLFISEMLDPPATGPEPPPGYDEQRDCKLARSTPERCYYFCDWGGGQTVTIWVPNPTGTVPCPDTPPKYPGPNTPAPQPLPAPKK